jgi:hypothetical protein
MILSNQDKAKSLFELPRRGRLHLDQTRAIVNNIKSARCMVVVSTDTGVRSQFVNREVCAARSINKPIIPMVEKKAKGKIGGLHTGLELMIFDKVKPKQGSILLCAR